MNDNYGRWQSDFNEVIQHCKNASSSAEQIIQWLQPETSDYFVLKPQFSGFFYTHWTYYYGNWMSVLYSSQVLQETCVCSSQRVTHT
ncbi:hypothetical protein [Geomicrobium sp. JCM 19037]|uniref:hypothetical protein n=1 Tax=Geomicrobium sp. JCM 19037 TaxID=1460634 RepID=UPI002101A718|nr:hypothetical protein [Geomicrobium sp. JCM 19037]